MARIHNFSAGPAVLPVEALEKVAKDIIEYEDTGLGVFEISHRSNIFAKILASMQERLTRLLDIPDTHLVLICTGGAHQQFSMVPMNLLEKDKEAGYVVSGTWSVKAEKEARKFGKTRVLGSSEEDNFTCIPEYKIPQGKDLSYVHITSNNTIFGTQFQHDIDTGEIPLICDASSDLLHRKIDVSKYGLIYASTQKNLGPAGATIVVIRKDLLERCSDALPVMLNYTTYSEKNSLHNTPPTGVIHVVDRVLEWLENLGGVSVIEERNRKKAGLIYETIDSSDGFYCGHSKKECRSIMNATFTIKDRSLEKLFLEQSEQKGMSGLKGHRSVGGIRASLYNSLPLAAAEDLARFMKEFQAAHN